MRSAHASIELCFAALPLFTTGFGWRGAAAAVGVLADGSDLQNNQPNHVSFSAIHVSVASHSNHHHNGMDIHADLSICIF